MITAAAKKLAAATKMNQTDAEVVVIVTAFTVVSTVTSIAIAAASGAVFKKLAN